MSPIAQLVARIDDREQLARALAHHIADGPAVDPDPTYEPRHRRSNAR